MTVVPAPQAGPPSDPTAIGRTALIIVFSLAMGIVMFAGVAISIRWGKPSDDPLLAYIGAGFALLMLPIKIFLPQFIAGNWFRRHAKEIRQDHRQALAGVYIHRIVTGRAPMEAAAFFNLIAYIVSGQWWTLGLVMVLLTLIVVPVPSQNDFEEWAGGVRRDFN